LINTHYYIVLLHVLYYNIYLSNINLMFWNWLALSQSVYRGNTFKSNLFIEKLI